jgi:hypothetical protein
MGINDVLKAIGSDYKLELSSQKFSSIDYKAKLNTLKESVTLKEAVKEEPAIEKSISRGPG